MPKLSAIVKQTKSVEVDIPMFAVKLNILYYPGVFTPRYEDRISSGLLETKDESTRLQKALDAENPQEVAEVLAQLKDKKQNYTVSMLDGLLADWDITDDDEIKLECNYENISDVPYPILNAIFEKIQGDMSPKAMNSGS